MVWAKYDREVRLAFFVQYLINLFLIVRFFLLTLFFKIRFFRNPKLRPLPVGIANENWPHGDVNTVRNLSRQLKPFTQRKTLLYINFSLDTNLKARNRTIRYMKKAFGKKEDVYFAQEKVSWSDYLKKLEDAKFVISPPGKTFFYFFKAQKFFKRLKKFLRD